MSNHNAQQNVDTTERAAELAQLLRSAMNYSARQILVALPPAKRSQSESMFLQDCARDRRAVSDENLATLLVLQGRADVHALSENIRALEVRCAASQPRCVFDASEQEQAANEALNLAQLKAHREKTRTAWEAAREYVQRQIDASRVLLDSIHHTLARMA